MSSSSTETPRRRHDAPDGRLGRRGHGRRVAEAGSATGSRPTRSSARSRPTRSTPTSSRPRPGRCRRSSSRSARPSRSARCSRGSPPTPSRARRTCEAVARAARARPTAAMEASGEAGELQGDTAGTRGRTARRRAPRRPRRYSPVVMRIAAEHGIDLEQVEGTGRGGRVRKQDVLASWSTAAAARSRRCTSRALQARRAGAGEDAQAALRRAPAPAARGRAAGGERAAVAHAPGDRRAHAAIAPDGGDVHDGRRGRPDRSRRRARASGLTSLPYVARATIEALREFPALNATLEDDTLTTLRAASTSGSRCRSARAG